MTERARQRRSPAGRGGAREPGAPPSALLSAPFAAVLVFALAVALAAAPATAAAADPEAWARAVRDNATMQLDEWLSGHTDVDQRAADGKTALMAAATAGDTALFERLITAGADPAAVNGKGASVLIYAAWRGEPEIVRALIRREVDLEQTASNGWTAMTMAAAKGRAEAIRLLLAAGARVDPPDVYGWTPLMRATDLGRARIVELLLVEGKANVHAINANGQTALHIAAATGRADLYRLLERHGADAQRADFAGATPAAIVAQRAGATH